MSVFDKTYNKRDIANIKKYEGKYEGERCFIIGNGPSLQINDLELLQKKNEYTFGSHRVYLSFDKTKWRPTFYFLQDGTMLFSYFKEISNLDIKHKFICDSGIMFHNLPRVKRSILFHIEYPKFYPFFPDFSIDCSVCVYEGMTVTYAEIQFATYMGFKEIYLLGIDHNYASILSPDGKVVKQEIKNYFVEEYDELGKIKNLPQTDKSTLAYMKAEIYSRYHGFRIFNATRGGELESFERINIENALKI
jgi:hypothetical protein